MNINNKDIKVILDFYIENDFDYTLLLHKYLSFISDIECTKIDHHNLVHTKHKESNMVREKDIKINHVNNNINNIKSIPELKEYVIKSNICKISETANNTVFSDGNMNSKIMLIGEAPGAKEDLQGIPFCGLSGKLLDKMLNAISLERKKNIYITNTVFWRPPGNRTPTNEETMACMPLLQKHIDLFDPMLIILVGGIALNTVMQSNKAISTVRGQFFDYHNKISNKKIPTTAIFHPAYLLRQHSQKATTWQDLQKIEQYIKDNKIPI